MATARWCLPEFRIWSSHQADATTANDCQRGPNHKKDRVSTLLRDRLTLKTSSMIKRDRDR